MDWSMSVRQTLASEIEGWERKVSPKMPVPQPTSMKDIFSEVGW